MALTLTRDIASLEEAGREVTSKLLSQTTPTSFSFIGSRNQTTATQPCQQPTSPPFMITTRHATITPLWYMLSSLSHAFSFYVSHCMSSFLLFGLHGSRIQPLWLWSILIGCSTRLVFSKKRPYWMVLMPVYVETAEGLVKPLVILPVLRSRIPKESGRNRKRRDNIRITGFRRIAITGGRGGITQGVNWGFFECF